ncbi:sensor histidine kinase [Clostridium perfringens]|uniref:sensor histidine kinase n=1 Tax=Clostridium perfringens TaxID=1502 RepID=UPI0024BBF551|nr:HAMP domain-containing sensor histidine kinase [Clostridium perfringens]EJT6166369.1 sensor histidine kinase [Clostridium perfringens]EJT6657835.1 sensor histidine kinase [Clostridium perfringens]MDZ5022842.1 hypothetical protein [Clostridium perfringens]MDZ5069486.1 hypothetical protein [Clostridium perfringens]MDZ5075588.1 hypothetical protein [Clostridium perfringens]
MNSKNKSFNLLPMYKVGIGELIDGLAIKLPNYCKKKKNQKCDDYYRRIFDEGTGIYICPYGFNSYVCKCSNNVDIFTGFRVENKYNVKKVNRKIEKDDINRVITYDEMKNFVDKYNSYIELSENHIYLKEFMENIVHDIRKFNANIKTKSTLIENKSKEKTLIHNYAKNIWAMSSYISTRLDIYNYLYVDQSFKMGEKSGFNFYKTFEKIKKCFSEEAKKKKNITINVSCNGTCEDIKAYSSIELLPFLIIDNAIKYTSQGENINITILQTQVEHKVIIEALGAKLEEDEKLSIFDRKYRGKYSKKYSNDGSGIGLYLAKKICDANDLTIDVDSIYDEEIRGKKLDEGLFKMVICLKK